MSDQMESRATRRKVVIPAKILSRGCAKMDISVTELSAVGCQIVSRTLMLKAGQEISIRFDTIELLPGFVRWSIGETADIEFERPLYEPVADHLAARYAL